MKRKQTNKTTTTKTIVENKQTNFFFLFTRSHQKKESKGDETFFGDGISERKVLIVFVKEQQNV